MWPPISRALALARFEPAGWTDSEVGYAHSIVDYVARWLGLRFRGDGALDQLAQAAQGETCSVCWGLIRADLEISAAAAEHYRRASEFLGNTGRAGPGSLDGRARWELRPPGGHHRAAVDRGQRDLAGGGRFAL